MTPKEQRAKAKLPPDGLLSTFSILQESSIIDQKSMLDKTLIAVSTFRNFAPLFILSLCVVRHPVRIFSAILYDPSSLRFLLSSEFVSVLHTQTAYDSSALKECFSRVDFSRAITSRLRKNLLRFGLEKPKLAAVTADDDVPSFGRTASK